MHINDEVLWPEKYRPTKIDECILPPRLKNIFENIRNQGQLVNMTLSGSSGRGKTTVALALAQEMDLDCLKINASKDGNIDTLRYKIQDFVSSMSLSGRRKMVVLDEADNLNIVSTQPALRGFIEDNSMNASFVLTLNFRNRVLDAIISRCPVIDFDFSPEEDKIQKITFLKRIVQILKLEKIDHDPKVVAQIINQLYPDFRSVLQTLQNLSMGGPIDMGVMNAFKTSDIDEVISFAKAKDFRAMRNWIAEKTLDAQIFFDKFDKGIERFIKPESQPQAVMLLGEYAYRSNLVVNQGINIAAFLTQLMVDCEFN